MPESLHAGDLLARRYRLDELLTERAGGRFWRAHDLVLDRHVAVHVIASEDTRAEALLAAARRTAPHHDRRLLRVLDADRDAGLCYVVNEWGAGTSLDIMLAESGPLSPRRAAWIVAEVADSLARAEEAGLRHGRVVPENVLIDLQGQVRVIGFGVDAVLHEAPTGDESSELLDTVGVLYAALTGKWAGASTSRVPPAPRAHGEVLRPRRVRAGIPRPLDAWCDRVINPSHAAGQRVVHDLSTMAGLAAALNEFVGDPTGLAQPGAWGTSAYPTQPEGQPASPADPADEVLTQQVEPVQLQEEPVELATQAGIPVFEDGDEVGWIATRTDAPAPPPPFEEQPARPLFAPEPPEGQPVRRPKPGTSAAQSPDYWPWESTGATSSAGGGAGSGVWPPVESADTSDDIVPGRNWIRLAMGLAIGVLVLVAAVAAYHLGSDDPAPADDATTQPPTVQPPTPLTDITADDFDPQGAAPQEENPDLVPNVLDGDPETSWRTSSYLQDFGPAGLKDGVGLRLDLGSTRAVRQVDIATLGGPTELAVYITNNPPDSVLDLTPVGTAAGVGALSVALDEAVSGRYVTIWLTSIPPVDGEFRGTITDVAVLG